MPEVAHKANNVTVRDSLVVEAVFVILSLGVALGAMHKGLHAFIMSGSSVVGQLSVGVPLGVLAGGALGLFVALRRGSLDGLGHLRSVTASPVGMVLLAGLSAGIGEEFLFRGVIQQVAGIWVASALFMLAHAQFWAVKPITPGKMAFAAFAFACGLGLGWLYSAYGLVCAITVHALIDMMGLGTLKRVLG